MSTAIDREAAADAIEEFLRALGRDPTREPELTATAERVADAWVDELLGGYGVDVDALLSKNVFAGSSALVVVRDVPVATTCPHHLMASTGIATVAFAPDEHLVGVETVPEMVDAFSRRLGTQEQLGERVTAALQKHLAPRWCACRIVLRHTCMTSRGSRSHGACVETLALAGSDVDEAVVYAAVGVGR
jgi:GTP cyclohydrolase IA